jgi:alkylation response protein AidB-like acyl-CoA dehydrogenase
MADELKSVRLDGVERIVAAVDAVVRESLTVASKRTAGGKGIDDEQVHVERLAYAATEARAARDLLTYAAGVAVNGSDPTVGAMAAAFAGEVAAKLRAQVEAHPDEFGIGDDRLNATLGSAEIRQLVRAATADRALAAIGRQVMEQRGANHSWLPDEMASMTRDSVRQFAEAEVLPIAEHIHRTDDLVPDTLITKMGELGFFGMAVPEEYGGGGMGNLGMIITTEELSRCSLAAAGSLITRPEILTKALLKGGTETQKQHWLPQIAAGQVMAAVSVTEPDTGSDVAAVKCPRRGGRGRRSERLRHQRRQGLVHVRRPRQRAGAAGAHRSEPEVGRPWPVAVHRPEGHLRGARVHDEAADGRDNARQGRTARRAIAACTRSRSRSRTTSCPAPISLARRAASTRASTCR